MSVLAALINCAIFQTTSTGRGGSANARTFVVEEGTFERVMEFEAGKILAMKQSETRKHMSLRGGSAVPDGKKKEFCECLLKLY